MYRASSLIPFYRVIVTITASPDTMAFKITFCAAMMVKFTTVAVLLAASSNTSVTSPCGVLIRIVAPGLAAMKSDERAGPVLV